MSIPRNINMPVTIPVGNASWTNGKWDGTRIGSSGFANNVQDGFNNPDFRAKLARGTDASSAYFRRHVTAKIPSFYVEVEKATVPKYHNLGVGVFHGMVRSVQYIPGRVIPDDIALKRLKGKLARDTSAFKGLIPLGEIKETSRLLQSTVDSTGSLIKALIGLKHGKVRNVRHLASKASDAWLNFSFGISPTISDLNSLVNSIGARMKETDHILRAKGSATDRWFDNSTSYWADNALCNGAVLHCDKYCYREHTYSVQYSVAYNVVLNSSNHYSLDDHFGLTFGDLPSLLWELTVFSWVADYFGTMGAFLEDLFTKPPGNTIYCTKSQKYTCKESSPISIIVQPGYNLVEASRSKVATCETYMFKRTVLGALPHRSVRFKTFDEIGIHSVNKLLNLSSILLK